MYTAVVFKVRVSGGLKTYMGYHAQMDSSVAWKYGGRFVFIGQATEDADLVIGVAMFQTDASFKAYRSDPEIEKLRVAAGVVSSSTEVIPLNSYTVVSGGFAPLVDSETYFVFSEGKLSLPFTTFIEKTMAEMDSDNIKGLLPGVGGVTAEDPSKYFILMVFTSKAAYEAYIDASDDAIAAREARGVITSESKFTPLTNVQVSFPEHPGQIILNLPADRSMYVMKIGGVLTKSWPIVKKNMLEVMKSDFGKYYASKGMTCVITAPYEKDDSKYLSIFQYSSMPEFKKAMADKEYTKKAAEIGTLPGAGLETVIAPGAVVNIPAPIMEPEVIVLGTGMLIKPFSAFKIDILQARTQAAIENNVAGIFAGVDAADDRKV